MGLRFASVGTCVFLTLVYGLPEDSSGLPPTDLSPSPTHLADTSSLFVAIPSGARPESRKGRQHWREKCAGALRERGLPYAFYVGCPSDNERVSEEAPTANEKLWATYLLKEQEEYKDIHFIPMRDHYMDLTDKTLQIFRDAYDSGAQFLVKVDDDTCLNPTMLLDFHHRQKYNEMSGIMLYAGDHFYHHRDVSYAGGPLYVLSRNLLGRILSNDLNSYVTLYSMYGTSSEDQNVGFWVEHVSRTCTDDCKIDRKMLKMAFGGRHMNSIWLIIRNLLIIVIPAACLLALSWFTCIFTDCNPVATLAHYKQVAQYQKINSEDIEIETI